MIFAAILPNAKLYGGVKRFFELGEVMETKGHTFYVFTPEGEAPEWFSGQVKTRPQSKLAEYVFDMIFVTEKRFLPLLLQTRSSVKVFYFVRASDDLRFLKKYPEVSLFSNSSNGYEVAIRKFKLPAYKAFGGINIHRFTPKQLVPKDAGSPIVVMAYGRIIEKKKGTLLVVKACKKLIKKGYAIKLLLFDTPVSEKAKKLIEKFDPKMPFDFILDHPVAQNAELFHRADIFVAAEKNAGVSNTAAEAMACGIPVIGTMSGTMDFLYHEETGIIVQRNSRSIASALERLINDFLLRKQIAERGRRQIETLSWENLAETILKYPGLQETVSQ